MTKDAGTTSKTKDWLHERGYFCEIVEQHSIRYGKSTIPIKKDLLGMFDVLAFSPRTFQMYGAQGCKTSDYAAHVKKIKKNPWFNFWLGGGLHTRLIWLIAWEDEAVKRITQYEAAYKRGVDIDPHLFL